MGSLVCVANVSGKLCLIPRTDNAGGYAGSVFATCLIFSVGTCTSIGDFVVPTKAVLPAVIGLSCAGKATGLVYMNGVFSGVVANTRTQQIGVFSVAHTNIEFAL